MARLVMTGVTAASARGPAHRTNQDAYLARRRRGLDLLAVADGVGGGAAGEVASALALQTFAEALQREVARSRPLAAAAAAATFRATEKVQAAQDRLSSTRQTMATTLTAVCLRNGEAVLAHVGDSRAYLWREGSLTVLSEDHSVAAEMARAGAPSAGHRALSVLTQAIGAPGLHPQVRPVTFQAGDVLLLCTDGVHKALPDASLAALLAGGEPAADAVRQAVVSGSRDDVTAVAAHLTLPRRDRFRSWIMTAAALAAGASLALAAAWQDTFLGLSGGQVALFRGMRAQVAGIRLHHAQRVYATSADDLPPLYRELLAQGLPVRDEGHALRILQQIPRRAP